MCRFKPIMPSEKSMTQFPPFFILTCSTWRLRKFNRQLCDNEIMHSVSYKPLYNELVAKGGMNDYLADIDEQAEKLFSILVGQLAESEGITEKLKAENQMLWVQRMNNIQNSAREVVYNDLIYA